MLTPIQIAVYDDKLEIWNCGTLPEDWTLNNLLGKHRSRPYNPDIANVFFRAGEIEAWGRGIERIVSACKKNGYPEPQFDYDGGGLWTIFHFGKEYADTTQKTIQKLSRKLSRKQPNFKLTSLNISKKLRTQHKKKWRKTLMEPHWEVSNIA